ncbi:hypothetical protein FRC07_013873 [Ceratobasidium sp. 392]|nr:hypothetical protein FRC07_013873 [Ceratobasidium sp. 392]
MSAIDNLGGFVAPAANERLETPTSSTSPVAVVPSPMPDLIDLTEDSVPRSASSPFAMRPAAPAHVRPNSLNADYLGDAPPAYDSVTSTSTATPRSPPEKSGASFTTEAGSLASQSEQAAARLASSRNPLDPPPPCFSRVVLPPSDTVTYEPLPNPYVIHGKTGKAFLDDAFAITPIPAFHKHDIETDDWIRFLEDVQTVARFNGGQKAVAGALPVTRHIGFIGHFVSKAVEQGMRKRNTANVVDLLNVWNDRFFNHRRDYRESGIDRDLPAPDRPQAQARSKGHHDDSSSSSSSSESDDDRVSYDRQEMRRQRREERRTRKRAHREERRAGRSARRVEKKTRSRESYRLVVASTN